MKTSPWLRWLIAAMALFALVLFAACGDDDDDDSGNDDGNNSENRDNDNDTPDDANTDDEDEQDDDSTSGGSDEEQYAAALCTAFTDFLDDLASIALDPDNQDATEEEQLSLSEGPFENLLGALQDADPPGDIEEYHDALVSNMEDTLDEIRAGDVEAFEEVSARELPEPPAGIDEKYSAIAQDIPECQATGVFGGGQP